VTRPLRIGLALGAGAARGWGHIGVLRALQAEGVHADVVCGCSIGAFVGAAYVSDELDRLEGWVASLRWQQVIALLDPGFRGGLIRGRKLVDFFHGHFEDRDIGVLGKPFACVATDLDSGREVWLRDGSVFDAVRASIALPGLLTPLARDGQLLVDGALVNPVPVSLCRALGADVVIAVDLGSERIGRNGRGDTADVPGWRQRLFGRFGFEGGKSEEANLPSLIEVLSASLNIMQVRIARSRMAGEPADVVVAPRLAHIGLMDFHRGGEAIAEGRAAVERMLPAIRHALSDAAAQLPR